MVKTACTQSLSNAFMGGAARGALHVYAHIHNKKDGLAYETLKQMDNALNAGVEINDYRIEVQIWHTAMYFGRKLKGSAD